MIKKVMRYYPITLEQVLRFTSATNIIYKPHIMHALMELGYCDKIFCDLYDELFDSKQGSCFVDFERPDVYEVLKLIKEANGISVLAHPKTYDSLDFLENAAEKGLINGVELWHPDCDEQTAEKISAIAKKHSLLVTGGTDFHGMYRGTPHPISTCITPEYALDALFAYKDKISGN